MIAFPIDSIYKIEENIAIDVDGLGLDLPHLRHDVRPLDNFNNFISMS
jgi:hypothetical protein